MTAFLQILHASCVALQILCVVSSAAVILSPSFVDIRLFSSFPNARKDVADRQILLFISACTSNIDYRNYIGRNVIVRTSPKRDLHRPIVYSRLFPAPGVLLCDDTNPAEFVPSSRDSAAVSS